MGTFLLIGDRKESPWTQTLAEALAPLGELYIISEQEAFQGVERERYDVIIVDSTVVKDVVPLVAHLRVRQPAARLVVATLSPTWQRARDAMQAGAFDYIRKSLDKQETLAAMKKILSRPRPGSTG